MGREVKRVPMDFDYPLRHIWYGYLFSFCYEEYEDGCERCKEFARIMGIPPKLYKNIPNDNPCPDWRKYFKVDPPTGEGYQLWGTTSEGEPRSPVFKTPEELAEWCAENDTVFGNIKATKEEWLKMIQEDMIAAEVNGVLYL